MLSTITLHCADYAPSVANIGAASAASTFHDSSSAHNDACSGICRYDTQRKTRDVVGKASLLQAALDRCPEVSVGNVRTPL